MKAVKLFTPLALALVGGLVYIAYLLGGDTLTWLAFLAVGGAVAALLVFASAFPIKAWRSNQQPEQHHFHTKEVRILDGRRSEAPKLYQLPAQPQSGLFPEMMRAAYQAGLLGTGERPPEAPAEDLVDPEMRELDPGAWQGDITP